MYSSYLWFVEVETVVHYLCQWRYLTPGALPTDESCGKLLPKNDKKEKYQMENESFFQTAQLRNPEQLLFSK